jgi:PAS domain S-box-containing protein
MVGSWDRPTWEPNLKRIGSAGDGASFGASASPAALRSVLERVIGQAPFGFALYDSDFRYLMVNDVLSALNGRSPAEHAGRTVFEIVPGLADQIVGHLERVLETGQTVVGVEIAGITPGDPDRRGVWVNSYYPVAGADGSRGVAALVQDVTDERRMQEQLASEQFRGALEAFLQPLILASVRPGAHGRRELRVEYLNPAASERTGLRPADAVGLLLTDVFPVVADLGLLDDYLRVYETGLAFVVRGLRYTRPGSTTPSEFDVSVSRTAAGLVISWRATDLEHRLLEQQGELLAERQRVAQLQRSFLPRRLPILAGTSLAARYRSAERDAPLGGDWYDAMVVDQRLAIVIGDVAGHGMNAVETMGVARITARAYLAEDPEPDALLARLDRYAQGMIRAAPLRPPLMTMIAAVYDPASRVLRWSNAGHLPPMLVDDDGARLLETPAQAPVGADPGSRRVHEVRLAPGSTLVLYTDGLIERRGEHLDEGFARLIRAATEGPGSTSQALPDDGAAVCDVLLDRCLDPVVQHDDVCLVVLRTS